MYKHQTIEYDKRLPARITLCDSSVDRCRGEPHWHEEMQLIYVDEGSLNMTVGASPTALKKARRQRDVASNAPMERLA